MREVSIKCINGKVCRIILITMIAGAGWLVAMSTALLTLLTIIKNF